MREGASFYLSKLKFQSVVLIVKFVLIFIAEDAGKYL